MTDTSEQVAAIAAGIGSDYLTVAEDAMEAFAAYCEQVAALQAENARLRSRLRESGVNELEARQQKTPPPTEK